MLSETEIKKERGSININKQDVINMNKLVREHIEHYCPYPEVLTKQEIKNINLLYQKGSLYMVEFNKKGHLIFRQRYPNFPLYFSGFALLINIIILSCILFKVYICK